MGVPRTICIYMHNDSIRLRILDQECDSQWESHHEKNKKEGPTKTSARILGMAQKNKERIHI